MASTSPSPNSSPSAVPPTSNASSPPPQVSSPSPSNPTITSPPPSTTLPNQTSEPPGPSTPSNSTTPPPQSPPRTPPGAPPPSSAQSPPPPPPSTPSPTSPPPSPPVSPPPSISSPPPAPPASTPSSISSPPPSPPASTTPSSSSVSPPPSPPTAPPAATSPPSSNSSAPPPSGSSSPPPQAATPPEVVSRSPPPANVSKPPSSSPPPPETEPPKNSPPARALPPPPSDSNSTSPPASTLPSPPRSVPSSSSPPLPPPPASTNLSGPTSTLPSIPTQKPAAKPTTEDNVTANATSKGGLNTGGAVTIGIAVGLVVLSLIVMTVWFVKKQKKRRNRVSVGYGMPSPFASSENSDSLFLRPYSPAPHVRNGSVSDCVYSPPEQGGVSKSRSWFTYEELLQATKGFSTENLLGEGGFGCVYKGVLADGREVAVKQLKIGGGQGEREFRAEVEIISRVHHRHLVSLVGYCISDHQRLLVYEYVPNNTLYYHLHGEGQPVMDWSTRVRIAAGAARGIAYLHEDCHPRIIHRDIKSSNILLDSNFEARVADFGLAKLALDSNTHVTTRVMGTFGYMAPEYATSGKLTEKSDVYSYGVVLLELITGRKPVDASQPMGDESLVEWARPLLSHAIDNEDFEGLVDPRLEKNYVAIEIFRMVEAAAACVRHSATKRPKMSLVVRALDSMYDTSDLSNGMKPGQSEIFDSAEQSAQIRMFRRMAFGSQDYSTDSFNQTRSSWKSRESRDQSQSSWASREHGNQSRVIDINRSGLWNNN